MAQHLHYWSCSRFADWLRGTDKPYALGWDEWDEWRDNARAAHPIRFWLADVLLNKLQDGFHNVFLQTDMWDAIDTYIHNRFIDRSHLIDTGLTPGRYYEFEDKVLYGLFNEFVDFVEIELSLHHRACNDGPRRPRRSAEWGLKHLEWELTLKHGDNDCVEKGDPLYGTPTPQAEAAKETLALYDWWVNKRPNRPDPHDIFTDDDHDKMFKFDGALDHKYEHLRKVEDQYEREDNAYLVRLILHRRCLWT